MWSCAGSQEGGIKLKNGPVSTLGAPGICGSVMRVVVASLGGTRSAGRLCVICRADNVLWPCGLFLFSKLCECALTSSAWQVRPPVRTCVSWMVIDAVLCKDRCWCACGRGQCSKFGLAGFRTVVLGVGSAIRGDSEIVVWVSRQPWHQSTHRVVGGSGSGMTNVLRMVCHTFPLAIGAMECVRFMLRPCGALLCTLGLLGKDVTISSRRRGRFVDTRGAVGCSLHWYVMDVLGGHLSCGPVRFAQLGFEN